MDSKTGNRRGFAYLTYYSAEDAAEAIKKNGRLPFRNVILQVDYGTQRK